jgi:hypothetical protein
MYRKETDTNVVRGLTPRQQFPLVTQAKPELFDKKPFDRGKRVMTIAKNRKHLQEEPSGGNQYVS